ncbi:hypothetical protein PHYPSEUDO_008181 [Phytophthora pseudosyringae]|uniref:EcxA zinc-binding domain-containing protein n=1 Tax=Phytophthora pseudosyringae TaxID=221518 RepID=A0A8T1WEA4_9STRA|nr:hypothetical protein PHYPSEUDO_008181 [Phytophthora pseudosyringae]
MAQVVDSPRFRIDSESDEELDIELGARQGPTSENMDDQNSEHDRAALLFTDRRSKRTKTGILAVAFLVLVGVSIGLAARFSREHPDSKSAETGDGVSVSFGSLETIGGEEIQKGDVVPFLDVQFYPDDRALFVLSKAHWNASFVIYPTVVKRAAPVQVGLERGGILLETNDFAFHFELSPDGRHLQLVQEYHYASLRGDKAEELQQMFDDSQWPGYATKVPIYAETDGAYYIPSDVFLANGFFVSSALVSSDFTALEDPSESFERNTMLFVEYELASGIIEVNYAIGLLPDEVMPQRVADDRVGYFANRYTQYSLTDEEPSDGNGYHRWDPQMTVIHRRKLELDSSGKATKDPITYYIDPSVPTEWREAFATGVEAWAPAFERIGFPNAIRAVLPGDSDWPSDYRLGDLRYNSISVMISEHTYAYGPTVMDPRSGEILHSDIVFEYGFFNSVMVDFDVKSPVGPPQSRTTASNDAAASNPSSGGKKTPHARSGRSRACGFAHEEQHQLDRMMLSSMVEDDNGYVPKRLIAQHFADIVMHEVGHTLGLRHNFAGSSAYSRDQLRDPAFVAEHGISTSVMDYLPVNIYSDLTTVDVETHAFFMTTIGTYDYAAIAYGYSVVDDEVPGFKHSRLTELAAAAPLFLTDESVGKMLNPYAQRFDLSSDMVDYASDRLKFVQNARSSNVALNKVPEDASWTTLWERERVHLRLIEQAIKIVRPILGGVNVTHAHRSKGEGSYNATFIPKDTQLRALKLLLRVVQAENGLFPQPKDYGSFVEVVGFDDDEDCNEATLDYACLGRKLVDVGAYVLHVRGKALIAALFPAMERIVQQDVLSPLTLDGLLAEVVKGLKAAPNSYTLTEFLNERLGDVVSNHDTDVRVKRAIEETWNMTQPPVVVVKAEDEDSS